MKLYKVNKSYVSFILWIILLTGTIILPQKLNLLLDRKYMNTVQFLEQGPTTFLPPIDLEFSKKLQIMYDAIHEGRSGLNLFSTISKDILLDTNLIPKLQEELQNFLSGETFQDIAVYNLEKNFLSASYYNIYGTKPSDSMSLWEINFGDYKTFNFSFLVDPKTYRIYAVKLFCKEATLYGEQLLASESEMIKLTDQFKQRCLNYYEANSASLYSIYQPDVILELVYDDFIAYPRRNLSIYDMPNISGIGIEIGFVDFWKVLLR